MTSNKKRRSSLLDNLAQVGASPAPTPGSTMMATNRALRSARSAVDAHHVWELDPETITDDRMTDRLAPDDVVDLRDAIDTNGQTVPILVRRHPSKSDHYLLVYGRRRLEAVRLSDKVAKIRALVADLDERDALTAQISENMARRDLSFIEKALFARELIDGGYGNQSQVAEVLTVPRSAISMALAILDTVGVDLIRAIGPAHGIGRPKWEAMGKAISVGNFSAEQLVDVAGLARSDFEIAAVSGTLSTEAPDASIQVFEAVFSYVQSQRQELAPAPVKRAPKLRTDLMIDGSAGGSVSRSEKSVAITLPRGPFSDWVADEAQSLIQELHTRWQKRAED